MIYNIYIYIYIIFLYFYIYIYIYIYVTRKSPSRWDNCLCSTRQECEVEILAVAARRGSSLRRNPGVQMGSPGTQGPPIAGWFIDVYSL